MNDNNIKMMFIGNLNQIRTKYKIKIYGYVIMPEHVHLLLHPPDGLMMGRMISLLKALTAKEALTYLRTRNSRIQEKLRVIRRSQPIMVFWQNRCYDHNCRTSQTTIEKIEYCHNNPVKRELVASPGDWLWSSYNWYMGAGDIPLIMEEIGL
jgi:putative transposase